MNSLCNHYETTRKSIWIHYFANLLSVSQLVYENTICFTILLWIHCLFRKLTLNSLSIASFHYEFTIYFAISLLIHLLFRGSIFNTVCFVISLNSLSVSLIHYSLLFVSWIPYTSETIFADSAWIIYCFRESTLNSLSISRPQFESDLFIANLLRIMTKLNSEKLFFSCGDFL